MKKDKNQEDLQIIPGVGPSIANDLRDLGFQQVNDLKNADPESMYRELCALHGYQDRCVLYVFRCAVYYANNSTYNPELLKWWNWKDSPRHSKMITRN